MFLSYSVARPHDEHGRMMNKGLLKKGTGLPHSLVRTRGLDFNWLVSN